jgi:hypothetical protein
VGPYWEAVADWVVAMEVPGNGLGRVCRKVLCYECAKIDLSLHRDQWK